MTETKITGAIAIALPGAIHNYVKDNTTHIATHYAVYMWMDDDNALYLHGNTSSGRTTGSFQGKHSSQIGSQYFAFSESVLNGRTLIEGLQDVESVQIDSKEVSWNGTLDELLVLLGLVKEENEE